MTITVRELIALLQKQDPDAEVYTEGCDCIGDAVDLIPGDAYGYSGAVMVTRGEES